MNHTAAEHCGHFIPVPARVYSTDILRRNLPEDNRVPTYVESIACWKVMGEPIDRQQRVYQMKASINQRLIESGERDRLKELLRTRLIECGWKDQLKAYCKEIIREKGVENVSVDDLIAAVTPRGRATVPDIIKRELLHQIKNFLMDQGGS
ncbi:transcription and mRNA export factor ENY2-like isoform X1 [Dermacentor variabilis]|uniref:transcription and mRNA export factor ENY2-like isoform X1 n=1 Tax=Dermacentor variabilis TaxID=34621 RepID=UPI003F5B1BC0